MTSAACLFSFHFSLLFGQPRAEDDICALI